MSTSIPRTSAAFKRWHAKHEKTFPRDLNRKAKFAAQALWTLENNPPESFKGKARSVVLGFLTDFAESYGTWKAEGGKVVPFKRK